MGTGLNLAHYPGGVRLTGVDLSPRMLARAARRARELGRDVDLRLGDAQALDFPDASFDAVVFTLALGTIPDERRALAEARRMLRPGGLWERRKPFEMESHVAPNLAATVLNRVQERHQSRLSLTASLLG